MERTLRATYRINAAATAACGAALLLAGHALAEPFAVPAAALWATGAGFVAFAAWLFAISRRRALAWTEAAAAGALDAVYALASFGALAAYGSHMTPALAVAVGVVAAPVTVSATIEILGALRLRGADAPATATRP
jgi:hypothetical protein